MERNTSMYHLILEKTNGLVQAINYHVELNQPLNLFWNWYFQTDCWKKYWNNQTSMPFNKRGFSNIFRIPRIQMEIWYWIRTGWIPTSLNLLKNMNCCTFLHVTTTWGSQNYQAKLIIELDLDNTNVHRRIGWKMTNFQETDSFTYEGTYI